MTEAAAWARAGAPHGAVVTAREQTAGRGRHGRAWHAGPGESLLASVVLRPDLGPDRLGLVPLAAGLAVAEALARFGVEARIKWPNDVRVGGRKLAGVLAESHWEAGRAVVVLGVGLNVAQVAFPGLDAPAVSLRQITGREVDPLAPLAPILDGLDRWLEVAARDPDTLVAAVEARLDGLGDDVSVHDPGSGRLVARGRALGLAASGALRLATDGGVAEVAAGEVTLRPPE